MPARQLEHVNIRTLHLKETVRFYTEVLGLRQGERPSTRPGAWLYDERDTPVIHVSHADATDPAQLQYLNEYLGHRDLDSLHGGGAIDHVAFVACDMPEFRMRLAAHDLPFRERVTDAGTPQIFLQDPNGISVELNFHGESP